MTKNRYIRLSLLVLVASLLTLLETTGSATAQDVRGCCAWNNGAACALGISQGFCAEKKGSFSVGEGYTCATPQNICCLRTRVCGFGAQQACCTAEQKCIQQRCCPMDSPRVCSGTCCQPGETKCDASGACCKPQATFRISAVRNGPPAQMDVTIQDSADGIKQIICRKLVNATMDMPEFPVGTKDPVTCTFTKIDPKLPAQVELASVSTTGCTTNGDPVLSVLRVAPDRDRVRETYAQIPAREHYLSVQNGRRGLDSVHVFINGTRVQILQLAQREVRMVDLKEYMQPGSNTITLTGFGAPGASGLILIADVPGLGNHPGPSALPAGMIWDPDTLPEGLNMRWGK